MKKTLFLFAFAFTLALNSAAQAAFLDTTFADNGSAVFTLNINNQYCRVKHVGLQSDGKIIAVGNTAVGNGARACAVRLHPDGTLDTSFGNGGEWYSNDIYFLYAFEVRIQSDDKIVMTGWGSGAAKVVRLNPDGSYDTTFGSNGTASFSIWPGGGTTILIDIELQPDGKILLSGYKNPESAIVRLRENSTLDPTFGNFGIVAVKPALFGAGASDVYGMKIGLSSDNAVLAAGVYKKPGVYEPGFVARYSSKGVLDTLFGEKGYAHLDHLSQQVADLFVLPNDEVLLLCDRDQSNSFSPKTTLVKWLPNGQLDLGFGENGYAIVPLPDNGFYCQNGFLQEDGKVIIFGIYPKSGVGEPRTCRLNPDGSMDTSLGLNGVLVSESPEAFLDGIVQPDGKIIAVAPYRDSNGNEYGNVRRYLASNIVSAAEIIEPLHSAFLYPNPVSIEPFTLTYVLSAASKVVISLADIQGRNLGTLLNEQRPEGKNETHLRLPEALANGLYLIKIASDRGSVVVKFSLNRR